ncbi:MAG TPA: serine hydrolase domain-containing protein [Candidatus Hydrogenedentes bacterium]|nr:serine hydrolase domain-containing protein [Candidatus Hydrogenedentota bacterium]
MCPHTVSPGILLCNLHKVLYVLLKKPLLCRVFSNEKKGNVFFKSLIIRNTAGRSRLPRYWEILSVYLLCLTPLLSIALADQGAVMTSVQGRPQNPTFQVLDDFVKELMKQWDIPGASLAVVEGGVLVHWRGFGYADRDRFIPVESDTLFRIASISKPITAVAVLRLVETGKLSLETTLAEVLPEQVRSVPDTNISKINIRQLLQHTAGWDDGDHDEVALRNDIRRLARLAGPDDAVTPMDIITRRLARPLDYVPGSDHAYSNFGYVVLGRIIEKVCQTPYLDAIRELVFVPVNQDCPILIGSPWLAQCAPKESCYYDYPDAPSTEAALKPGKAVAWPDGGIAIASLDAALGCVTSAPCLSRFVDAVFAAREGRPGLLSKDTLEEILKHPAGAPGADEETYYGLGWRVKYVDGKPYIWHGGSLPGTSSLVVYVPNGSTLALLMNSRPQAWEAFNDHLHQIMGKFVHMPINE